MLVDILPILRNLPILNNNPYLKKELYSQIPKVKPSPYQEDGYLILLDRMRRYSESYWSR